MASSFKNALVVTLALFLSAAVATPQQKEVLDGDFWREQALTDIIPYWYDHVRDQENGAFFMKSQPFVEAKAPLGQVSRDDQSAGIRILRRLPPLRRKEVLRGHPLAVEYLLKTCLG